MKSSLVVKHNDLIEARYDLSLNEQKIILYAASQIDREKENFNMIKISIKDFTNLIGTTQERYTEFKEIAKTLISKTIYIEKEGSKLVTNWLSSMEYLTAEGVIELEFSQKLIPYLLQLKARFTRYQLENILFLESKYSIRIYELLKQYETIGKRQFELEEFKKSLMIEGQYDRVYDLEKRILTIAVGEINLHTDINITYEKIKLGRKVTGLIFKIVPKNIDDKIYIEYLNESYNIEEMKEKMGISEENFNTKQVIALYEMAVQKTQDLDLDIFEYVHLNYLHMMQKGAARNKYSYLLKALEEDYARAAAQLKVEYIINEEEYSA